MKVLSAFALKRAWLADALTRRAIAWLRTTSFFIDRHLVAVNTELLRASERPLLVMCDQGVPKPGTNAGDSAVLMYLELFQKQGWRTLFCPLYPERSRCSVTPLRSNGTIFIDSPQALQAWLSRHGDSVAVTWLARPQVADALLPNIRLYTSAPVVYFTHDIHFIRLQREAAITGDESIAAKAASAKRAECDIFKSVDGILAPGPAEVAVIHNVVPHKPVAAIPLHFYEENELVTRSAGHFASLANIIFVGGFNHTPNVDAALFLVRSVMPLVWQQRPDAILYLVGHSAPQSVVSLASERVVVTGAVPDVRPFYDCARLTLMGLRYGAGVKGKALEAFRLGVPVCGTPIALEGIDATAGHDALIAETAEGLAANAVTLLSDSALCEAMSNAGIALMRRDYTAAAARASLEKVIDFDNYGASFGAASIRNE